MSKLSKLKTKRVGKKVLLTLFIFSSLFIFGAISSVQATEGIPTLRSADRYEVGDAKAIDNLIGNNLDDLAKLSGKQVEQLSGLAKMSDEVIDLSRVNFSGRAVQNGQKHS